MNRNTNLRTVFLYSSLLLALAATLGWLSRPAATELPPARKLDTSLLDTDRQTVQVRVDSLLRALADIQRQHPDVFSCRDIRDALQFRATDRKLFDDLLLGGHTLDEFTRLKQGLTSASAGYGFDTLVETVNGQRAVRLPAHVLQSIHRHRNQNL